MEIRMKKALVPDNRVREILEFEEVDFGPTEKEAGPEWEEVVGPVDRPKTMAHPKALARWIRCEEQAEATND